MKNFALIKDGLVSDVFVADEAIILEQMFPEHQVVESTEETGPACIGGSYESGKFVAPKPFDSWVKNAEGTSWVPPVAYPKDGKVYNWDEESVNWSVVTPS